MSGEEQDLKLNDLPRAMLHHVLDFLGPRDLCVASAVCTRWRDLNHDPASKQVWQAFYGQKWRPPAGQRLQQVECWQQLYNSKMQERWSFSGRPTSDMLQGHGDAVRCIGLLPSCNLLASGSRDRSVRIWDLKAGLVLTTVRSPVGSVRSLSLDEDLLVVGGTDPDYQLCVWRPPRTVSLPNDGAHFDMKRPVRLRGHTGPISTLALDSTLIFSGSWDYTVRMWSRGSYEQAPLCVSVLTFDDWLWSVCPCGSSLLVACGSSAMVHDIHTGDRVREYRGSKPQGHQVATRVEGTRDGRYMFASTQEHTLVAYDLRSSSTSPAVVLWEHKAEVRALSFEDPWLAAALSDGTTVLLDVEATMRARRSSSQKAQLASAAAPRSFTAPGCMPHCVCITSQWLAAGEQGGLVRTWDFTTSDAARERASRGRAARMTRRQRRAANKASSESYQPVDESSSPPTKEQAIAVARQALLHSLLAEEHAGHSEGENSRHLPDNAEYGKVIDQNDESITHGDVAGEAMSEGGGAIEGESEEEEATSAGTGHGGEEDEHLGPVRRRERDRRQGRRGSGKSMGPHSGRLPGRQHSMPSPPPLAMSRSGSDCGGQRSASGMATWRIVRPTRGPASGVGK